ncbi:threonylcarbamoyl-AMP synthase [Oceanicola sp. D3]|uniref:L-threonylcarbamoyladenylate synthase n=1 Tax=Oceanicola sp. D3 TaxID=2587163 RepID=UPI001120D744|nr:L-threonylcarbamoyladenylate synthase [Oceanicola sp. D3]QDC07815.1 threonylcarbamoyl-AMP synthase [Oceanicola sp. D3]
MTERLEGEAGLTRAVELLRAGKLVAIPTETVYGLAGDAREGEAVAAIFEAKGRPRFNPLICHLASLEAAGRFGVIEGAALRLAEAFWPGPLTLVVPLREAAGLSPLVTAGLNSVALRVPALPLAHRLLDAFGGPLAAPSANPSGKISPSTAAHVAEGLEGRIAAVLDGGPADVGLESTIIDCTGPEPRLLRPGGLPLETLEAALGTPLGRDAPTDDTAPSSPGQLSSHYAPGKAVRLNVTTPPESSLFLAFGPGFPAATANLSPSGDLREAAANLFAMLHKLDALPGAEIAVAPIPQRGLGLAINDRLSRAAAPRG